MTDRSLSHTEQIRRLINRGLDEQDTPVIKKILREEVVPAGYSDPVSTEVIIDNLHLLYDAMPDLQHHIDNIWQDGDMVIVRYKNRGTFENELSIEQGPFAGLHAEPTGDSIEYRGVYLARFEAGEIVEWENRSDRLSAFQQFGVIDEPDVQTSS